MLLPCAAALLLVAGLQSPVPDRGQAEALARSGQTAEALALFERIVAANRFDADARQWVARLALRLGDVDRAAAERRVAVSGTYAYGSEAFEDLTADRLGSLGTNTVALGLRLDLRSLTRITTTVEHQWRSNHTTVSRFGISLVQVMP